MSITTSDIKENNMLQKDIKQVVGSLVSELDFYFENKGFKEEKTDLFTLGKSILLYKRLIWCFSLIRHIIRMY